VDAFPLIAQFGQVNIYPGEGRVLLTRLNTQSIKVLESITRFWHGSGPIGQRV